MGSLVPFRQTTALVPSTRPRPPTGPRQFDLTLDNARLRGLSAPERQSALQALTHLLLEAKGVAVATQEAGHEHE